MSAFEPKKKAAQPSDADLPVTTARGRVLSEGPDGLALRVAGERVFATHALPNLGALVIGRGVGVDVRIDDPSISRRHVRLHLGPRLRVEDLGSSNGTRVRDRVIPTGQLIEIGVDEMIE